MRERTYLDHAATAPMLPAARDAMLEGVARWANPSSLHAEGRAARAALEGARERIKAALGWTGELIFTSGASEAARLAFRRGRTEGAKPIISAVEHDAVLRQVSEDEQLNAPVASDGRVDLATFGELLRRVAAGHGRAALVAVQHVNPETGVIQPIAEIAGAVAAAGGALFVDCAQSAGKLPLPSADLLALSAHKLGGPPGIGALLVRDLGRLVPEGGQEQGYRGGTENLPAALGFAAAVEARALVGQEPEWSVRQRENRLLLEERIGAAGGAAVCANGVRSPFTATYHMPGMSAAAQLVRFDLLGFAVSAGSACSSGTTKQSHVLRALGLPADHAANCVRVSFGPDTRREEVERFADAWTALAGDARRRAA
ncbi:MAG: Cysteine desulfurase [uncultured Sphingomonadaceae bacterium]|uniref:Cysteine desulfurase n=1 Tax=uncultured Sphingomonadaceae bacterium TaxID=169976 RepID=A0A6J4T776_9SPHN|nr:MAG: Cysteine desulfurase [uncultured Sphingomonadaceae bacterium]